MDEHEKIKLPEVSPEEMWMLICYLMDSKINLEDSIYDLIHKPMVFADDTERHDAFVDIVTADHTPYNLWRWNHLWRTHYQEQMSHYGDCVKFPTSCYVCAIQDHIQLAQKILDKLKKATIEPNCKKE